MKSLGQETLKAVDDLVEIGGFASADEAVLAAIEAVAEPDAIGLATGLEPDGGTEAGRVGHGGARLLGRIDCGWPTRMGRGGCCAQGQGRNSGLPHPVAADRWRPKPMKHPDSPYEWLARLGYPPRPCCSAGSAALTPSACGC